MKCHSRGDRPCIDDVCYSQGWCAWPQEVIEHMAVRETGMVRELEKLAVQRSQTGPGTDGGDICRDDAIEQAWGLIANAGGGDWMRETAEWRAAAERWRDRWLLSRPTADGGRAVMLADEIAAVTPPLIEGRGPCMPAAGPGTDGRLFSCPDCTDRTPHERGSDECAAWGGPGTDGGDQA